MFKHVAFRIVAGLVLLAAIAGIGFFAFRAGMGHAATANLELPVAESVAPFHPYYGMHPFGGGLFGLLFVFFLIALAFGSLRRMIWGPRWGWRHMHGPLGPGRCGEGVHPMFAEMHRRAHATPGWDKEPEDKKPEA
ncbi:MAG: hypothetical protein FJZ96_08490 [Chloroflexi bacterium]|nr:hypothetical protein [Chloroflexota bacterium]